MAHNFSILDDRGKINFIKNFFDTKGYIRIKEGVEKIFLWNNKWEWWLSGK